MHLRRAPVLSMLLLTAFGAGSVPPARADALDGVLEVRSAYVSGDQGVLQLFARVAYPVNDDIRGALKDGLTLMFDLDMVVSRERRFWMDETIREYTLKRELSYHAVSDRYVMRISSSPVRPSSTAMQRWKKRSRRSATWTRFRSWCRRSCRQTANTVSRCAPACGAEDCPTPLRVLLFWTDDWHRESEWFSWSLQR
jgi:hypothetical protein